jgi:hypothetical protein
MEPEMEVVESSEEPEDKKAKIVNAAKKVGKFAAVAAVAGLSAMGLVVVAAVIESKIEQRRDPEGFKAQLEAEALETLNELREGAE